MGSADRHQDGGGYPFSGYIRHGDTQPATLERKEVDQVSPDLLGRNVAGIEIEPGHPGHLLRDQQLLDVPRDREIEIKLSFLDLHGQEFVVVNGQPRLFGQGSEPGKSRLR